MVLLTKRQRGGSLLNDSKTNPLDKRIVFLDVDGVLNSERFFRENKIGKKRFPTYEEMLDPAAFKLLSGLVNGTGSKIVVSSSWREIPEAFKVLEKVLDFFSLPHIGVTPTLVKKCRGAEVQAWLEENKFCGHYVIIDDTPDFYSYQQPFYVQTSWALGLTPQKVAKARRVLESDAWDMAPIKVSVGE